MKKDKIYTFSALSVGILAAGTVIILLVKYLLPALLPFLIAWTVAFAVRGPARLLSHRIGFPERILRVLFAILGTLLLFLAIFFILRESVGALWRFLTDMGEGNAIYEIITELTNPKLPIFGDMMPEELVERIGETLRSMLTTALTALGTALTSWVAVIPRAVLFVVVTVIAVVYFTLDLERINRTVKQLLPRRLGDTLSLLRREAFTVGAKYIGSYLLIMLITFTIMLLGFALLRIPNAFLIALAVAVLDILPVIGVGTVLVPWSIFEFASGNTALGISLLILLLVNEVIRQLAEPRIVGKNLGIHPLLTLVLLYVGYSLFGIYGLFLIPLVPTVLGILKKHRSLSQETEAPRDR